jgi:guanosine-3',5'-bis(diphosphate) 3'-pyrophosphohydrolase
MTDRNTDITIAIPALMEAMLFAADKHRGQKRKDAQGTPYINHPIMVVNLMASIGGITDIEALQAGMLHDTVEDTETSPEEIETRFGYAVRSLVMEVTDDKKLEKQERKWRQIEKAHQARRQDREPDRPHCLAACGLAARTAAAVRGLEQQGDRRMPGTQ